MANEVKSRERGMTSPPITAVKRVDFLRQRATNRGDNKWDIAKLVEPNQTVKNKKYISAPFDGHMWK